MAAPARQTGWSRPILACLLLAACPAPQAQTLTVYRCVAADGSVALQDRPCPPGSTQERARFPAAAAAAAPLPPLPEPAPAELPAQTGPTPAPPPPPLWECVRHDGSRYESADGVPERRWVPLWVLGLDPRAPPALFGRPGPRSPQPPPAAPGAPLRPPGVEALGPGAWVSDHCLRLSDAEACGRYRDRRDALRRRWRLAMPGERARIRLEERPLAAMLRERCGL